MWADTGTILLGSVLLVFGADSLAQGVSGLLVRNSGQSWLRALAAAAVAALAPLLAIAIAAVLVGRAELAAGAALGGAIAQLGLLLALAALAAPLRVRVPTLAWLNPALIGAVVLVWLLGLDHAYSRLDGGIMLLAFVGIAALLARGIWRQRSLAESLSDAPAPSFSTSRSLLRLLVGGVLVGLGAWRVLVGTSGLATTILLNPLILALLVLGPVSAVAGAPTAILAARRGRGEIALAQALFAALAATLLLFGGVVLAHALAIPASIWRFELPILLTLAVAVYPMMRSDGELSRREGAVLLLAWLGFLAIELWLSFA
jgi:cation:H+ antiporter